MKRAFLIVITGLFVLFLLSSLGLSEEAEKKPDEKAKVEVKIETKDVVKEPFEMEREELEEDDDEDKDDEEDKDDDEDDEKLEKREEHERDIYRELFEMIRRQNEEIRQLREEIFRLRRIIEERITFPQPQIRRGEGTPPRRFEREQPREEYQRRDEQRFERPMDIDSEIRKLEDKVRREPDNVDAHMDLARLYEDRGKIEAAIEQYRIVTKIRPDFNPPYTAIRRLEARIRETRSEEEFNIGEVISSSIEQVTIKTLEGETMTFKVPKIRKDDGTWAPNREIGDRANALKKGERVKIFWNKIEGEKIIRRIENE